MQGARGVRVFKGIEAGLVSFLEWARREEKQAEGRRVCGWAASPGASLSSGQLGVLG